MTDEVITVEDIMKAAHHAADAQEEYNSDKNAWEDLAALITKASAGEACEQPTTRFKTKDKVKKVGGDYTFEGEVVAAFPKLSGQIRYVVEDDRGILHVYSDRVLKARSAGGK